ncbi:EamA family transporter [Acetobacteraceae bacterium ESL0709]|nr:EamA family transporter [Acetobacteraceae bacterium ESL0697]MDF7677648.1 EamA family transporter [Acetobacteraceae bacterium ESL0709]
MLASSWLFWALLSAFFASMTALLAKMGVDGIDPDIATFIRTFVVIILLAVLLLVTGKFRITVSFNSRACLFLLLSGLATGASWLCYFRALKIGDAARVAPIDKLSVVFVAVLGVMFLGEHLSSKGWLGIILIGAGVMLVAVG